MKGLTLDQFKEVTEFSQKHHKLANYLTPEQRLERLKEFPQMGEHGFGIKYIDSCYDSRDASLWSISFRQGSDGVNFRTNHFAMNDKPFGWKYDNLYDLCMAYLKGEFKPKAEFYLRNTF